MISFVAKEKEEGDILCEVTSEIILTTLDEFQCSSRPLYTNSHFTSAFTGFYIAKTKVRYLMNMQLSWFAVDLSPKIESPALIKIYDHTNHDLKIFMMDSLPKNASIPSTSLPSEFQVNYETQEGVNSAVFSVKYDHLLAEENRKVLVLFNDLITVKCKHTTL